MLGTRGQSELGTAPLSLELHVSDLKNLIGYLAIDSAHLVGISHGARLALEFSLEFPQMVDRLVLCSLSAQTSDRCRAIVRSWLEILHRSDLKTMAWAALPTVFGNRFFKDHQKILDKIVAAVVVEQGVTGHDFIASVAVDVDRRGMVTRLKRLLDDCKGPLGQYERKLAHGVHSAEEFAKSRPGD